jgi:hypothetical protein
MNGNDNTKRKRVKAEETQPGNPHELTIKQHIIPARSISRFAGSSGRVSVRVKGRVKPLQMSPEHRMFCAKRAWDQRAESGYMKEIEDEYQTLADLIVNGHRSLSETQSNAVTRFWSLWKWRFYFNLNPLPDQTLNGVIPDNLTKDNRETLEKKGVAYLQPDGTMPGRMMSGMAIQFRNDQDFATYKGNRWGIVSSRTAEFVMGDNFVRTLAVPVTPQIVLSLGNDDKEFSRAEVSSFNQLAMSGSFRYVLARDFTSCPS